MEASGVEIRRIPGNGLQLGLYVEGQESGRATVSEDVLSDMQTMLGLSREQVEEQLRKALLQLHEGQLERVQLDPPREWPAGSRRFVANYTFRDYRTVIGGVVWYEVESGETGPGHVSPFVRNKLRFDVHRELVGDDPRVEQLRKVLG